MDWSKNDIIDAILARYEARIGSGVHPDEPTQAHKALKKLTRKELWVLERLTAIDDPRAFAGGPALAVVK